MRNKYHILLYILPWFFGLYVLSESASIDSFLMAVAFSYFVLFLYLHDRKKAKIKLLLSKRIDEIDNMSGVEFEQFLQAYFRKNGYKANLTKTSGDYGADLILEKSYAKTVIQAKRYSSTVGIKAVHEVIGAKGYYGADMALAITNRHFTQAARNLAKSNNVELWEREKIIEILS